jgi:hypothetical protein
LPDTKLILAHLLAEIAEEGRLHLKFAADHRAAGEIIKAAFSVARAEGLAEAGDAVMAAMQQLVSGAIGHSRHPEGPQDAR